MGGHAFPDGASALDGPLPALGTVEGACEDHPRFWVRGWPVGSAPDAPVLGLFLGQSQRGLHSVGQCAEVTVQGSPEQSYPGNDDHRDEARQN